jgi:hypothetical protein
MKTDQVNEGQRPNDYNIMQPILPTATVNTDQFKI